MDVIVGYDMTAGGDDALRAALILSDDEGGLSLGVVHVVTQQELDKTGQLFSEEKRRTAIEALYPLLWRRVGDGIDAMGLGEPEVDVIVRFAPVHLVQSQPRIGIELAQVAIDRGAGRLALGRTGRPGSVSEWLLDRCELLPRPSRAPARSLVLRVDEVNLGVTPSAAITATPRSR